MKRTWLSLSVFLLAACQATPGVLPPAAQLGMTLDVAAFENALANSPIMDWSSNTFASTRLLEARRQRAVARKAYHVNYAGFPAPVWTDTFVGGQVSNTPAYYFSDVYHTGPNPNPGDFVFVMTNAAVGTKSFFVLDPVTGAIKNGTGWDVLTTVGAPTGDKVDNSSLVLSARGSQAMFVTTGGYFGAINTGTGAKTAGFALGTGRTTVHSAPFLDNSYAPGIDGTMRVWVASTDSTDTTGQLHRFDYANGTWTAAAALTLSGSAADGSGGAKTSAGFRCSPIAWNNKVYIGDTKGLFWEYDLATNKARYWDLSPFSGLGTLQILAPAAIDFSAGMVVDKIFVAAGPRVFWLDPTANTLVPSINLVVDTATSTPGPKLQGSLGGYNPAAGGGTYNLKATDTVSAGPSGSGFTNNGDAFGNEVVGSFHINPGDGLPVTGYLKFAIPSAAFAGKLPVSATLTMTIDNYTVPDTSDAGSIYRTSIYTQTGGVDTTTVWTSANMTDKNQPRLLVPTPFSQRSGPCKPNGTSYPWVVTGAVPRDNATYSFAMRGANKVYNGPAGASTTAPGYYGAFYKTTGYRPNLTVGLSAYGLNGAIMAQPVLLAQSPNPKLYVANSNALFELDYTNGSTFVDASQTYFSLMASGRGGVGNVGVVDGTSKFIQNQVTTAIGSDGTNYYGYVCDENGLTGIPHLNKFKLPLNHAANADSLTNVFNLPASSLRTTPYITWDYFSGSTYFACQGTASTLYRLGQ